MINLSNSLDNLKRQITNKLPDHINKVFEESTYDLRHRQIGATAPQIGDTLPSKTKPSPSRLYKCFTLLR